MHDLEKLSKTVKDMLECRIEAVLDDMSATALCDLPEDEAVTAEKFLQLTTDIVQSASEILATYVFISQAFIYSYKKYVTSTFINTFALNLMQ